MMVAVAVSRPPTATTLSATGRKLQLFSESSSLLQRAVRGKDTKACQNTMYVTSLVAQAAKAVPGC